MTVSYTETGIYKAKRGRDAPEKTGFLFITLAGNRKIVFNSDVNLKGGLSSSIVVDGGSESQGSSRLMIPTRVFFSSLMDRVGSGQVGSGQVRSFSKSHGLGPFTVARSDPTRLDPTRPARFDPNRERPCQQRTCDGAFKRRKRHTQRTTPTGYRLFLVIVAAPGNHEYFF